MSETVGKGSQRAAHHSAIHKGGATVGAKSAAVGGDAPHVDAVAPHVEAPRAAPLPSGASASKRLQRFVKADAVKSGEHPKATNLLDLRANAEDDALDVVFQKHLADFRIAFAEMRKQPPSVV